MKRLIIALSALIGLTGTALAADMAPVVTKAPVLAPVTTYNWTGFYSATGLGVAWWDINGVFVLFPNDNHNTTASRFNLASMFGAQYQWGNVVLGVEGAFNKLYGNDFGTSLSISNDCVGFTGPADRTCSSRVNNIWTVGGRLGYAWDRFMVFGTGGYANGHVYAQFLTTSTGVVSSQSDARHDGWYAGGGFEYFVTKFWMSDVILGAEYQHIDLDSVRHFRVGGTAGVVDNATRDFRATEDIVRARIVFKWTPAGTVVAKY